MRRTRQAVVLARPLARTVWWFPLPVAGALGITLLSLDGPAPMKLRLAGVALCVGAAFVLDDEAADSLAGSPAPLLFRRLLRIALVLPVVAALWALLVWYSGEPVGSAPTLELVAMLAVTLAVAAVAAPLVPDGRGGIAAGPALLVLLAVAVLTLPERWPLFAAGPEDPSWGEAQSRWAVILAAGLLTLVHASLDSARRPAFRARARHLSRFADRVHPPPKEDTP